ncbi:ribosome-inactivating protein [Tanacetum coccineum]
MKSTLSSITLVNVYVVGYLLGTLIPTLHFLNDILRDELLEAFPSQYYTHRRLGFAGNYGSLLCREETQLGHGALNDAIRNLYYGQSQRSALLVIIQMVSEAIRIRYIEHLIRQNMLGENLNFIPDLRAISMENRWSDLSEQIQQSDATRMPVPVAVGADEQCLYGEPTTNIIGRNGQCVDVKLNQYNNGNPIILWGCENAQRNQLWTFKSDGTIRSNGKCLTTNGYASGNNIMIFNCDTAVPKATKWSLYNACTIVNPTSGFVIAAETSTQGTVLMLLEDTNSSRQAWSAGNYTQPTITYISGFLEMCFAILFYSDRTLCVTSDGHWFLNSIILHECQGWGNKRWTFMANGTILNPNAWLVMDVWYLFASIDSDWHTDSLSIYPSKGWSVQKGEFRKVMLEIWMLLEKLLAELFP